MSYRHHAARVRLSVCGLVCRRSGGFAVSRTSRFFLSAKGSATRLKQRGAGACASLTLGSLAVSSTVLAAEPADTPAAPPSGPAELEEVVVTGIRASLQKSLDIKQQSIGV